MTAMLGYTDERLSWLRSGKVREYTVLTSQSGIKYFMTITTDRVSAFDVVSKQGIPNKGAVLCALSRYGYQKTQDIVSNWVLSSPHPLIDVGYYYEPYPLEFIVRGYLTGSLGKLYQQGCRDICGLHLPDGLQADQMFKQPLFTPTTKAAIGQHDENISPAEIIAAGLMTPEELERVEVTSLFLYQRGQELAAEKGLIFVDTKYEFGRGADGAPVVLDEVGTPDSSRFWEKSSYEELFWAHKPQVQLSKEFLREYLTTIGYDGRQGEMPELPATVIDQLSRRYLELAARMTGQEAAALTLDYENLEAQLRGEVTKILTQLDIV